MIDSTELVLRSRSVLTSDDPAAKLPIEDFYAAIPLAIARWKTTLGQNRKITASTGDITITNGIADVKTAIEAVGILPDKVKWAEIYIAYNGQPALAVQFVNSRDRLLLIGVQDKFFIKAYFDGEKMYFGKVNNAVPDDIQFSFTAESNPSNLSNMPADLIGELGLALAEVMRTYNTDGEHKGVMKRLSQK